MYIFFFPFQSITALIPGFFDDLVFSSDDSSIDEDDDTARSRLFSKFSIYSRVQKSIENCSVWSKMALREVGVSLP